VESVVVRELQCI